ncbi:MAG: protein kinase, partial [Oligoflexia bacterium]|nr:protein kinase [Oligoflexia bacterium]
MAEFSLGPFVVEHPLGRGGMGAVWRAHHAHTGLPVAVKVMTPEKLRKPAFVHAFSDELRAIATLDHPNIVRVFDVSVVDDAVERSSAGRMVCGSPYLVMELADGGSLRAEPPPRSWDSVRQVLLTLLSALAHAHARGVIHRDLKPGNVLWAPSLQPGGPRRPLLTDFGIAQLAQGLSPSVAGHSSPTWGTPAYMAPERFTREWRDLGPWTDLYSLGCLGYTLLRGRPPYVGKPLTQVIQAHLYGPIPTLHARCPVPPDLDLWLRRTLAKAPIDRFQTAADAAHALRKLGEATVGQAAKENTSGSTPPDLHPRARGSSIAPLPSSPGASSTAEDPPPPGDVTVQSAEATWTDEHFTGPSAPPSPTVRDDGQTRRRQPRDRQAPPPLPSDWRDLLPPSRQDDLPGGGLRLFGLRTVAMVDRLAERDALWATLKQVCERGRPAGVLLRGAVGTGKTRLAHWLGEQAAVAGAATFLRADHGVGEGVPALARMIATYLRVGGLGPRALRSRVLAWLEDQYAKSDAFARDLIAVASLGCGQRMARATRPRDLHHAVRRFLSLLASERPVVLMLDDVALGPTSLSLARELLEQGPRVPVVLVMTARAEVLRARPSAAATLVSLADEGRLRVIDVAPLAAPHRLALVQNTLGVQAELGRVVARRTAGNPLFTLTLVRDWVARGLLTEGPDGLISTTGSTPPLPVDLHALWSARLTHLLSTGQPTDRPALELAAALGEAVNDDEWHAVCTASRVLLPDDLRTRLIAERLATPGPMGWRFVHDTVRNSLLNTAREEGRIEAAHAACAAMLAQREGAGDNPLAGVRVGRHLAASGRADQALPMLMDGAISLLSGGAPTTALLVTTEVEHLVHQLTPDDAALPRAQALALRADILLEQGHQAHAKHFAYQ